MEGLLIADGVKDNMFHAVRCDLNYAVHHVLY